MKTSTLKFTLIILLFTGTISYGQVPKGFNYQAIARDGNNPITTTLPVRITIQSEENGGTIFWIEEHASVTPDEVGLFTLVIGTGEKQDGSTVNTFDDIDWSVTPKYIKTEIYYGTWKTMGSAKLWTVPYAMVSGSAFSGVSNPFVTNGDTLLISKSVGIGTDNLYKAKLAVTGDNTLSEDALFEVKRKDGQTMFAVYNQGVRINIPMIDGTKGAKGGFAIGGFSGTKGTLYDLFSLNKDSARIYLDKTPNLTKGAKGGFAIGGFAYSGKTDIEIQNYLSVTPDSTRVYVKEGVKAAKGGFAIGGFTGSKGNSANFLNVTKENYFIGHESGSKNVSGVYNATLGYQSGKNIYDGVYNVFIGNGSGISNSSGSYNVFVGNGTGTSNISAYYNTFIGHNSGYYSNNFFNSFYGCNSGFATINGSSNTFIGVNSGRLYEKGSGNTFLGTDAGEGGPGDTFNHSTTAYNDFNTAIGFQAGNMIEDGDNNLYLGASSGANNTSGSGNVFIGYQSGYTEYGSNKLYISNSWTNTLIYGDFSLARVGLGTTTPGYKLDVVGDINITGEFRVNGSPISSTTLVTGNLTAAGPILVSATQKVIGGEAIISISDATTSSKGAVQLSNSYSGTSTILATTEKSVSDGLATKVTGSGMTMGKIYVTGSGNLNIITISEGTIALNWEVTGNWIEIINSSTHQCNYWYQKQDGSVTTGNSMAIAAGGSKKIVNPINTDNSGYEIHFGQADAQTGSCSVWLQYFNGVLTGHYIEY